MVAVSREVLCAQPGQGPGAWGTQGESTGFLLGPRGPASGKARWLCLWSGDGGVFTAECPAALVSRTSVPST